MALVPFDQGFFSIYLNWKKKIKKVKIQYVLGKVLKRTFNSLISYPKGIKIQYNENKPGYKQNKFRCGQQFHVVYVLKIHIKLIFAFFFFFL